MTKTDDFRQIAKAIKRAQAANGLFDLAPEFRALCLSEQGYTPAGAVAALGAYANTHPMVRDLIVVAQRERPYWEASFKATDPTETVRAGAARLIVNLEPWATDGERVLEFARHIGRLIRKAPQNPFSAQLLEALGLDEERIE